MTIRVSPAIVQSVVAEFIAALGVKTCATLIGKSEFTVYNAKDPNSGYSLPHEDLLTLDAAVAKVRGEAEGTPYALWVARRVRALSGLHPVGAGRDLTAESLQVGAAVGRMQDLVRQAAVGAGVCSLTQNQRITLQQAVVGLSRDVVALEAALAVGGAA